MVVMMEKLPTTGRSSPYADRMELYLRIVNVVMPNNCDFTSVLPSCASK